MAGPGGREIARVSVRVLPDTSAFGRSLEKYLHRMERSLRVEIPTVVDSTGFIRDVQRLADMAERSARVTLDALVDGDRVNAEVAAIAKRASGHDVTLNVDGDRRKISGAVRSIGRLTSGLTRLGGAGSIASAGLGPAIAGIAGLGSIAMQASGAVFLLPAAVGAAAVGVGTLTLAFAGFGEAMKNLGDPAKFAEAIKDLAPAAQETAIAVRDLKPAFDALKLDVQQQFFEGLGTTVREVGGTYLPILRDGLRQVAAAMGAA